MMGPLSLSILTLILYAAAEGFSILHLRTDEEGYGRATTSLLVLGFVVHFAALYVGARSVHSVPYRDLPASMSFFAWMVVASYLILLLRHREASTGPFLLPIPLLFLGASILAHPLPPISHPRLMGSLFAFHVTMAIIGYAALSLSFVLAQLYIIQNKQIRRHKLGLLFSRLPALDVLSRLHQTSVLIGVSALAVATALGLVRAKQNWGTYWDPKVLVTVVIIAIYLLTLFPRVLGWGGRKVALLSISGFLMVLFSYTIVNLFISNEHLFR